MIAYQIILIDYNIHVCWNFIPISSFINWQRQKFNFYCCPWTKTWADFFLISSRSSCRCLCSIIAGDKTVHEPERAHPLATVNKQKLKKRKKGIKTFSINQDYQTFTVKPLLLAATFPAVEFCRSFFVLHHSWASGCVCIVIACTTSEIAI